MKLRIFAPILFLLFLVVLTPVFANGQGFESIDTNKTLKDYFYSNQDVYVKETKIQPGGDCGDPGDAISVYVVNHKNWTADGRFPYFDGVSLAGYVKKIQVMINNDRSIYWNLGKFQPGFYDIVQGGGDYRGNDLYQGGCLDQLGAPISDGGFDVLNLGQCFTNSECPQSFTCRNANYVNGQLGSCVSSPLPPTFCLEIITPAYDPMAKECKNFSNSCLAEGWIKGECPYTQQNETGLPICPTFAPPYCPNGILVSQGYDAKGCILPAKCIQNETQQQTIYVKYILDLTKVNLLIFIVGLIFSLGTIGISYVMKNVMGVGVGITSLVIIILWLVFLV